MMSPREAPGGGGLVTGWECLFKVVEAEAQCIVGVQREDAGEEHTHPHTQTPPPPPQVFDVKDAEEKD